MVRGGRQARTLIAFAFAVAASVAACTVDPIDPDGRACPCVAGWVCDTAVRCEGNGAGADPPPARRDKVAGTSLPVGDAWNTGYFEGEDNCNSADDFTVDFDNRGMDDNQSDGTDWGEDDLSRKCGTDGLMEWQWFVFARER